MNYAHLMVNTYSSRRVNYNTLAALLSGFPSHSLLIVSSATWQNRAPHYLTCLFIKRNLAYRNEALLAASRGEIT